MLDLQDSLDSAVILLIIIAVFTVFAHSKISDIRDELREANRLKKLEMEIQRGDLQEIVNAIHYRP